jgi:hypothetical protein
MLGDPPSISETAFVARRWGLKAQGREIFRL